MASCAEGKTWGANGKISCKLGGVAEWVSREFAFRWNAPVNGDFAIAKLAGAGKGNKVGSVAEWFKALVLKTSDGVSHP